MPYIPTADRRAIERGAAADSPGELNYAIARLVDHYITKHGFCYNVINDVVGVLECHKLELYRRVAAPYEDSKRVQNGEVFTAAWQPGQVTGEWDGA